MAGYQPVRGSRPLLFERLVGPARSAMESESDHGPPRMHGEQELLVSLRRELSDLLNTRAPLAIQELELRVRSTIDYGIPDLSAFPVGQNDAMERLAKHLADAIKVYEPRLHDPVVEIGRLAANTASLSIIVRGTLEHGTMRNMPVTFEFLPEAI